MHGPNSLNDARSASSRAPAQVAAVGNESILCEVSSASSSSDKRRGKPKQKLKIEMCSKLKFGI